MSEWFEKQYNERYGKLWESDGKEAILEWARAKSQKSIDRMFKVIDGMNLLDKPKLKHFKKAFHTQGKRYLSEKAPKVSCTLCQTSGWAYVVLGGDYQGNAKVIQAPRKCAYYIIQSIPCSCDKGVYINKNEKLYSKDTLKRLHRLIFANAEQCRKFIDQCNAAEAKTEEVTDGS